MPVGVLRFRDKAHPQHAVRGREPRFSKFPAQKTPAKRELVGMALKNRIERVMSSLKAGSSCGCADLAAKMDRGGIEWCEANRSQIVHHLVSNRDILADALSQISSAHAAVGWIAGTGWADPILRLGASWLLDRAIEDARLPPVKRIPRSVRGSGKRPRRAKPRTTIQTRLWQEAISAPPPPPDPFTETPVIHFGAHLWPIPGAWEWHIAKWKELSETITGKCVVVAVVGPDTASAEEVRQRLGDRFEVVVAKNTPEGENPSFRHLQSVIPTGQNDVLLYAHGKGVRSHTSGSPAVRLWSEMMYETVLFNQSRIIDRLDAGYVAFGAFRTFGNAPLRPVYRWHYSGTFFAVRAKHLSNRSVKNGYGGVEAWPGDHFAPQNCWCDFADNRRLMAQYDLITMYPETVDSQMQWEVDRIGGPRCEQHKRELDWFLSQISGMSRCLVIGSRNGGLEHQLQKRGHTTVSIDIAPQSDNTVTKMIIGSSRDDAVREKARAAGPFDIVFIDGDHSYAGAKADFEFALTLRPRMIALHDIADAVKHQREGCEVDRLWTEIKATHTTEEKIVGCGWGGIGIVRL